VKGNDTQSMFDSLFKFFNQFVPLSSAEFSLIKDKIELRHYGKKEQLIKAGDTELYLYFIIKGFTREFFYKGHQEVVIDVVSEGTITGSVTSFFTGEPSRYFIEAIEPVSALRISKKNLEELYQSHNKWERFGRVLTAHFLLQQERHILDNIRFTIRERFVNFIAEHPGFLLRVPQKYLASYLDIKPETFSRLKHIIKEKVVKK
jgi:CRP-like cAMP-binding protein